MKYTVTVNGKQYEVEIERAGQPQAAPQQVYQAQAPQPVQSVQPVQAPVPQAAPAPVAPAAGIEVVSPMPGNIFDITVSVGQSVNAGDCLVVIEAMKMENEIVAPQAGTVKQILVNKGTVVDTNDVLVVLN